MPATIDSRQSKVESNLGRGSYQSPVTSHQSPRIVTYREFVQPGLSPRMLAQAIAERSGRERIADVFLSPDAFAHRTSESSIAEQLGEVLTVNGLPRPTAADDDRIGGWQLMYQLLESDAWVITDNCAKLIDGLPLLVRDDDRVEDIRKVDGDDSADAARYGLVSGGRFAGITAQLARSGGYESRGDFARGDDPSGLGGAAPWAGQAPPLQSGPRFVTGMPLGEQIARQVSATDPTSQAIHYQRLETEARRQFRPHKFTGRRHW